MTFKHLETVLFTCFFLFIGDDAADKVGMGTVQVVHQFVQGFLYILMSNYEGKVNIRNHWKVQNLISCSLHEFEEQKYHNGV
jgi:hypothetical protein